MASQAYAAAVAEITRGIVAVSGLAAEAAEPGWVVVHCSSEEMASWMAEAISAENVQSRRLGQQLFLPVSDNFRLEEEIKNVITVVAKTSHYWQEHLPAEIKHTLRLQKWLGRLKYRLFGSR